MSMLSKSAFLLAAAAVAAAFSTPVDAAVISGAYTITGSDFVGPTAAPFSSIVETLSFTFDTSVTGPQTSGITLISGTVTPNSTLGFVYTAATDGLMIGGLASTIPFADLGSNDFAIFLGNVSSDSPAVSIVSYSVGEGAAYVARSTSIAPYAPDATPTPDPSSVPEPESMLLFGTGVFGIAIVRRKRPVA